MLSSSTGPTLIPLVAIYRGASLAFVVVDPSKFFDDYEVEISDADAEKLHLTNENDANVLVIVTIPGGGKSYGKSCGSGNRQF